MVILETTLESGKKYSSEKVDMIEMNRIGVTKIESDKEKITLYFEVS